MIDVDRLDRELADYMVHNAMGTSNVKTKDEVIMAMNERGVFGLGGVSRETAVRALCESRVRLINREEPVPIGTTNDGWCVLTKLSEYNAVFARENSRAMAIHDGLARLREAFYTFTARRLGTGIAGRQERCGTMSPSTC